MYTWYLQLGIIGNRMRLGVRFYSGESNRAVVVEKEIDVINAKLPRHVSSPSNKEIETTGSLKQQGKLRTEKPIIVQQGIPFVNSNCVLILLLYNGCELLFSQHSSARSNRDF
jgi:hypothetical protein